MDARFLLSLLLCLILRCSARSRSRFSTAISASLLMILAIALRFSTGESPQDCASTKSSTNCSVRSVTRWLNTSSDLPARTASSPSGAADSGGRSWSSSSRTMRCTHCCESTRTRIGCFEDRRSVYPITRLWNSSKSAFCSRSERA